MSRIRPLIGKPTAYMYATAAEEVESRRLAGLNKLYNPHTLRFLSPRIVGIKKILELGCGSGHLAAELLAQSDPRINYVGADRDPAQVVSTRQMLHAYPNAKVIQLDITNELNKLQDEGPFDLIYCRWLLVHLSKSIRTQVLRNIFSLLTKSGTFFCDECDNRNVCFRPIDANLKTVAPYEEATRLWSQISHGLMEILGNDLELDSTKIQYDFMEASDGKSSSNFEGQYKVILRGREQKKLLTDGYRSSLKIVEEASGLPFEKIISIFDKCIDDDNVEIEFLTQNIVTFKNYSN